MLLTMHPDSYQDLSTICLFTYLLNTAMDGRMELLSSEYKRILCALFVEKNMTPV